MERRAIALWVATCCLLLQGVAPTENDTTQNTTWNFDADSTTSDEDTLGTTWNADIEITTYTAMQEDVCDVAASWSRHNATALNVTWSGGAAENSPVLVSAVRLCYSDPSCQSTPFEVTTTFREGSVVMGLKQNAVYEVTATFNCTAPDSSWTIPVPAGAANLRVSNTTDTSVRLTWDPFLAPLDGQSLLYVVAVEKGATSKTDKTWFGIRALKPYVEYTFRVKAELDGKPQPDWTEEVTTRTKAGVPHAPTALTTTSLTNTTVGLTWEAPSIFTGPILQYRIRRKEESGSSSQEISTTSNDTSYLLDRLTPYSWYTFAVSAETEAGPGNWSDELSVLTKVGVPHAPTALTTTSLTNSTVGLTWEVPAHSTGPILRYRIRFEEESGSGSREMQTKSNDTNYLATELTPYSWYTFAVSAETEAGPGNWSEGLKVRTQVGVPHAPTALTTTSLTNSSVGLTWEAPAHSTGPILRYRIRWEEEPGSGSREIQTESNDTLYQVTELTPYSWYTFAVSAETEAGPGNWSEGLKVRTQVGVPHAPTALKATSVTNTTVRLTWESPAITNGPILRYQIRRTEDSGSGSREIQTTSNDTSCNVDGLTPYSWYTFAVSAETEAGPGNWSEGLKVRTQVGVPHAPTSLQATSLTNTSAGLTWEAPANSTGPILRYQIRWGVKTGTGIQKIQTQSNDTSYVVDRLTPYSWYTCAVSAETEAGPGNWSEELKMRTKVGVPHAPTALNTTLITNTTVGLTWEVPAISTGPILQYRIRRKEESGAGSQEILTRSNDTSYLLDRLTPYSWYTFAVSAETEAGPGNWSENVKVRTKVGVPSVPRNLRLEPKSDVSLQVSWTQPEFLRSPEVQYVVSWGLYGQADNFSEKETGGEAAGEQTIRHVITDLLPYTNYSVRVSAVNQAGRGPATGAMRAQTKIGVPSPAVIRTVSTVGWRVARVMWTTAGPFPGPVSFSLQAWREPIACSDKLSSVVDREVKGVEGAAEWSAGTRTTRVEDLTPYATYSFAVRLQTDAGEGVASEKSEHLRMPPEAPGRPQSVVVDCRWSSTQAKISWSPPRDHNGQIVRYQVRYGIVGESEEMQTWDVHESAVCSDQKHLISGMRPERRYRFSVTATVAGVREEGAPGVPRGLCELPAGIPSLGNTSRLLANSRTPQQVTLEWTGDTFSDYMGEIVRYSVLVGRENALGESTSGKDSEGAPAWYDFSSGDSDFYQATPNGWNPFGTTGDDPLRCQNETIEAEGNRTLLRCTVGGDSPCPDNQTYCNGPLEPDTPYELKIRGFTRGGFNETQLLHVRTGRLPKKSMAGAWAAAVVTLVLLAGLAGRGYVLYRKGILKSTVSATWSKMWHGKEASSDSGDSAQEMQRNNKSRPVPTRYFSEHVRRMMSDSHLQFSQEFEELKCASPVLPCTVAESEENRPKNRWMNIFPFDHSRVKLLPLCDEPGSDFINASYIPGPCSPREYIASQGPLPHTVDDLWRMVWEQSVSTIVMLTQCTERGKRKCEMYWPEQGEATHYGDLAVHTVSESMLATHVIRVIRLQLGSYDRQVKQIHFMHWPDFGCPDRPEDLIEFVAAVRDHLPRRNPGPILVHCSAGVGRTGTFIAVDRLRREIGEEVDVYGTVLELRHHRTNMVQTEDQYIYIHLCVEQLIRARDRPPNPAAENIYCNVNELDTSF